jgi:glycosyltransferase involved in cell wall biosynthesis
MTHHSSKTNILFILQTFRTGGSERVVVDLCRRLDRGRFNCFAAALIDGDLRETLERMGVPTLLPRIRSARQDALSVMRGVSDFIGASAVRVVNAHHFTPFFYGFYGARRHGCRIFYTAHSRREVEVMDRSWRVLGGVLVRLADGAIGISPDVSEAVRRQFRLPEKKVLTLTNAVDHSRFAVDVDARAKRREFGIGENDRVIGCVGNLRWDKNYPNLIRAFGMLGERVRGARLVIAGEGKRKEDLEALIAGMGLEGRVLLLGARDDVPEIMKAMDVYCLSSFREGLPLSLLEAMSAGLPVVGTDVPGIRDVIVDGDTGLLVPSDDPAKLSEALFKVLTDGDLARGLSERGLRYVLGEHGSERWVAKYEALFSANGHSAAAAGGGVNAGRAPLMV